MATYFSHSVPGSAVRKVEVINVRFLLICLNADQPKCIIQGIKTVRKERTADEA